ncbi:hypothetical protein B0H19DRAFT_527678 [Mycena capillaripes]|nr:hypothetical protein B0H19DRAFT_527678 [Mycena capillaripes]
MMLVGALVASSSMSPNHWYSLDIGWAWIPSLERRRMPHPTRVRSPVSTFFNGLLTRASRSSRVAEKGSTFLVNYLRPKSLMDAEATAAWDTLPSDIFPSHLPRRGKGRPQIGGVAIFSLFAELHVGTCRFSSSLSLLHDGHRDRVTATSLILRNTGEFFSIYFSAAG